MNIKILNKFKWIHCLEAQNILKGPEEHWKKSGFMWITLNHFHSFNLYYARMLFRSQPIWSLTLSYLCRSSPQGQTGPRSIQKACEGSLTRWRSRVHSILWAWVLSRASTSISNLKGSCVQRRWVEQTTNYSWVPQSSTGVRIIHFFHVRCNEIYTTFTCKHRQMKTS